MPTKSRRTLWKQKLEASPLRKVGIVFFFNAELLTPSLSEALHILLTRPLLHQFKPKRHPWPHLKNDSTNSRLCMYFFPPYSQSFSPVLLIKYLLFLRADNIGGLTNLSPKALSPHAIYLKSTKANWFLPWQPDPGSQLSPLLQSLVLAWFGLIWFREQRRITGRRGSVRNKSKPKLTSHLSTKKPFSSSPQWKTNLAHSPLRQSHQFLELWMEVGASKSHLQPPKPLTETIHSASSGWSYPRRESSVREWMPSCQVLYRPWNFKYGYSISRSTSEPWKMRSNLHLQLWIRSNMLSLQAPKHRRR